VKTVQGMDVRQAPGWTGGGAAITFQLGKLETTALLRRRADINHGLIPRLVEYAIATPTLSKDPNLR